MAPNKYDFGKMSSLKLEGNCKRGGQDKDIGNEQQKSE